MPTSEQAARLIALNEALSADVSAMNIKLDGLEDKSRHTRWIVYALSAAFVVAVLVWMTARINHVSDKLDLTIAQRVASCETGNMARAADRAFWEDPTDGMLSLIAPKGSSPQAKAFAAKVAAKVDKKDAQQDCSPILHGGQPVSITSSSPPRTNSTLTTR